MSQTLVPEIDLGYWKSWINLPAATRVSATSLTIPGDFTSVFSGGDKLMLTDTTTKYFYILTPVTFSAGVTTLTITGGSDYSLVGTGAGALTGVAFSKAQTPTGFPQWFNYTPTFANTTLGNGTTTGAFAINGRTVNWRASFTLGSTSAVAGGPTISLPVTATTLPTRTPMGTAYYNNSTNDWSGNVMYSSTTAAALTILLSGTNGRADAVSAGNPFTWASTHIMAASGSYPF